MFDEEREVWNAVIEETIDSFRDFLIYVGSGKRD